METKHNWNQDEFHPTQQCFFCKKRVAVTHDHGELYKVIRNTMKFGYVVNYTTARIPIPICSQCSVVHRDVSKLFRVLKFISWVITTGILYYWMNASHPVERIFSLILSMAVAYPSCSLLLFVMATIWGLCSKNDEVAFVKDYPVIKKLLSMGWEWNIPATKYGKRKYENINEDTINRMDVEYQQEAKEVIVDFLMWCRAEESQNKSMPATPNVM